MGCVVPFLPSLAEASLLPEGHGPTQHVREGKQPSSSRLGSPGLSRPCHHAPCPSAGKHGALPLQPRLCRTRSVLLRQVLIAQCFGMRANSQRGGTSPVRHCTQKQCRVLEPLTGHRSALGLCGGAWRQPDPGPAALSRGDASASSSTVW